MSIILFQAIKALIAMIKIIYKRIKGKYKKTKKYDETLGNEEFRSNS
jgi:hypothetical protein